MKIAAARPPRRRHDDEKVIAQRDSEIEHELSDGWELDAEVLIQLRELRHGEGDEVGQDDDHGDDQDGGIDQRGGERFFEAGADAEVGNVLFEDAGEVAAAFTGGDDGDVDRREGALRGERFREQSAFADSLADVLQDWPEARGGGAFGEQIESFQDGQAGFDESVELLIEDDEIVEDDFFGAVRAAELREKIEMHADGKNVEALIGETLAGFALGLGRLQLLEDPAGSISDFTYVLAHVCIDGPEGGTSLAKFSIPVAGDMGRREEVFRINTGVTGCRKPGICRAAIHARGR